MRIAFLDHCEWDFHVLSVDSSPLGGSQSAACYLARALAAQGHDVFLYSGLSLPGIYGGVNCLRWGPPALTQLASQRFDVVVCVLAPGPSLQIRQAIGPHTRLVLWNQHAADQPAVQTLRDPRQRDVYDGFAMVSDWQRLTYQQVLGISPQRMVVLRNAIAPVFVNQFPGPVPILSQKASPPVLTYTSTPFRGLDLLIDAFPSICAAVPGARLRIFSSMKVYKMPAAQDEADFGELYRRCRRTAGVELVGSLPQPELAREMRGAAVLAYPNTFPETSCIAVMEAMASGCRIVTSALGALPETTAGFARLIPLPPTREQYLRQFIDQTVQACRECAPGNSACEEHLRRQVAYVNANATWDLRARQWIHWLENLRRPGPS